LLTTVPREVPEFATTVQTWVNGDYASARGLEFALTRRFKHGFGFELNYGYGYVNGTASDPSVRFPSVGTCAISSSLRPSSPSDGTSGTPSPRP